MITNLLNTPIALGVGLGFVAGSFGYILARFWIRPLLSYGSIKRQIAAALAAAGSAAESKTGRPDVAVLRQTAAALTDCYNDTLPNWYKLALANRDESPLEAARHLMTLADTRNTEHAADRIAKVKAHLKIT
ncbi:MAG: hypothetical protein JEZ11_16720 [Desulfobacterales bacterium]|nr:hypothetical protein [Desulfobacterales bacterium]